MKLTPELLAEAIDSTNLRLDAKDSDIIKLCEEAMRERFACVMIYPASIPLAAKVLSGSGIKIGTVVGFPSGRFSSEAKQAEIEQAARAGAHEVDIVMNYSALLEGRDEEVLSELKRLTLCAHGLGLQIKVITENCYLQETHMLKALELCEEAKVDFIKTSTGFGTSGAKVEQLQLWANNKRSSIRLKAAGGIKTLQDARTLLEAGASRLGTSNAGALLAELRGETPAACPTSSY